MPDAFSPIPPETLQTMSSEAAALITALQQQVDQLQRENAELRQAQTLSDRNNERYTSLADALPVYISYLDRERRYQFVNRTYEERFGLKREQICGQYIWQIMGKDAYQVICPYVNLALSGQTISYEAAQPDPVLGIRHTSVTLVPNYDETGRVHGCYTLVTDITTRKQLELELQASQAQLSEVLDHANTAIFSFRICNDVVQPYDYISKGCELIYGYSAAEFMIDPGLWISLVHPGDRERILTTKRNLMRSNLHANIRESKISYEYRCFHRDSSLRWIASSLTMCWDAETQSWMLTAVDTDITRLKQVEQELQQAKEEAEVSSRAKSIFLANMSHEFRTPLHAILGFTKLISQETSLSPTQQEYIDIINSSGQHLLNLINDILDLSKIEAGQIRLQTGSFHLHQFLAEIEDLFRLRAQSKALQLVIHRSPDLPKFILGDEQRLRQILINLLSNAIKFTAVGQVQLTIKVLTQHDRPHLHCVVTDTGFGIPEHELESIFEPFVQSRTQTSHLEGTGLGLSISRQFARLMGGDLWAESHYGQGSQFFLEVPIEIETPLHLSHPEPSSRPIALAPEQHYRILVVEDNWENRHFLVQLLQLFGFEVEIAEDGEQAITIWQRWQPHLIWMDLLMPVMDGLTATQVIRQKIADQQQIAATAATSESTPNGTPFVIPKIIALTASAFDSDRTKALAAGCDSFVCKPLSESVILETLKQVLKVEYIYDQGSSAAAMVEPRSYQDVLLNGLLNAPPSWVIRLHQLALQLDYQQALTLVDEIADQQPNLAQVLTPILNNFDFESILTLTYPVIHTYDDPQNHYGSIESPYFGYERGRRQAESEPMNPD